MMPVFIGLTAALLMMALAIGQTMIAQREARARAMNEGQALVELNELMSATLSAETGQRGYLLTGEADYIAPLAEAGNRRARAITRLREIAGDGPEEAALREQLDRLDTMTFTKFAEIEDTLTLARAGFRNQAVALVRADFGKMQMDAIANEVARLAADRARLERESFARAEALERRLPPLVAVLSLLILAVVYAGFRAERRRSLAEVEADQAAALREANERAELLARELNHRVKNLFSVVLSIVSLSGRKQASRGEVVEDILARIRALSLAHATSQGGSHGAAHIGLAAVIARTIAPYDDADDSRARVRMAGPEVELPAQAATPIGLIVHELATNAVKYGALSAPGGTIEIAWDLREPPQEDEVPPEQTRQIVLIWTETGGPAIDPQAPPAGHGFGSQMTTQAAAQLGGSLEREWAASGVVVRLSFPLPAESRPARR